MVEDDLEKFRRFMIEQQAQFWNDLRAMEERQERFDREMKDFHREMNVFRRDTEERFRGLVDVSMSLARHGEETDRRMRELSEETDRRIREISEETNYKLNALIDTVDKLVKRNGHA